MRTLPHTKSCFVCGESNPVGLGLRFETDGKTVQTRLTARPEHIGFKGTLHGGITATILDEIMVWACAVQTRQFSFCAELTVRYVRPVMPGTDLEVTAELVANRRNKIFEAKAELRDTSGGVLATASGKYLPIRDKNTSELLDDVVGDMAILEDLQPTVKKD